MSYFSLQDHLLPIPPKNYWNHRSEQQLYRALSLLFCIIILIEYNCRCLSSYFSRCCYYWLLFNRDCDGIILSCPWHVDRRFYHFSLHSLIGFLLLSSKPGLKKEYSSGLVPSGSLFRDALSWIASFTKFKDFFNLNFTSMPNWSSCPSHSLEVIADHDAGEYLHNFRSGLLLWVTECAITRLECSVAALAITLRVLFRSISSAILLLYLPRTIIIFS